MHEEIKEVKKLMNFYTGLPNNELFLWVLSLLDEKIFKSSKLSKEEHLLLVLMKLKLGLLHTDLAFRFGLELCNVICQDVLRITRTVYVLLTAVKLKLNVLLILIPELKHAQTWFTIAEELASS